MATNEEFFMQHRKSRIGPQSNSWNHSTRTGFDLTRAAEGPKLTIQTSSKPITVNVSKSALIIIDMQNFFLSPAFGKSTSSPGHNACKQLIDYAIPAARKAGMQIIWVNWGLTEEEARTMPPGVFRVFGFEAVEEDSEYGDGLEPAAEGMGVDRHGETKRFCRGLGTDCGPVVLENGENRDAGRLLMRDSWNAALYHPLEQIYLEGRTFEETPDVWIHKNRLSGMWGARTELEDFLEKEGIQTLFFTGVNTDQCVGGTLMDAFSKGYDCVLLKDGCGTSSPEYAQRCFEFNAERTLGFCTTCEEFSKGANNNM